MKIKYEIIGEQLTIETAAVQAAYALDVSATIAESQRDQAGLLAVADAWMKLADFLAALRDAEDKRPEKKQQNVKMGFQPSSEPAEQDDENEITVEDEEDNAGSTSHDHEHDESDGDSDSTEG